MAAFLQYTLHFQLVRHPCRSPEVFFFFCSQLTSLFVVFFTWWSAQHIARTSAEMVSISCTQLNNLFCFCLLSHMICSSSCKQAMQSDPRVTQLVQELGRTMEALAEEEEESVLPSVLVLNKVSDSFVYFLVTSLSYLAETRWCTIKALPRLNEYDGP